MDKEESRGERPIIISHEIDEGGEKDSPAVTIANTIGIRMFIERSNIQMLTRNKNVIRLGRCDTSSCWCYRKGSRSSCALEITGSNQNNKPHDVFIKRVYKELKKDLQGSDCDFCKMRVLRNLAYNHVRSMFCSA